MNNMTFKNEIVASFVGAFANQSRGAKDRDAQVFQTLAAMKARRTEAAQDEWIWPMISLGSSITAAVCYAVASRDYDRYTEALELAYSFGIMLGEHYQEANIERTAERVTCYDFLEDKGVINAILSGEGSRDELDELRAQREAKAVQATGFTGKKLQDYLSGKIDYKGNEVSAKLKKALNLAAKEMVAEQDVDTISEVRKFLTEEIHLNGVGDLKEVIVAAIMDGWKSETELDLSRMASLTVKMLGKLIKKIADFEEKLAIYNTPTGLNNIKMQRAASNVEFKLPNFKASKELLIAAVLQQSVELVEERKDENLRGIDAGLASGDSFADDDLSTEDLF